MIVKITIGEYVITYITRTRSYDISNADPYFTLKCLDRTVQTRLACNGDPYFGPDRFRRPKPPNPSVNQKFGKGSTGFHHYGPENQHLRHLVGPGARVWHLCAKVRLHKASRVSREAERTQHQCGNPSASSSSTTDPSSCGTRALATLVPQVDSTLLLCGFPLRVSGDTTVHYLIPSAPSTRSPPFTIDSSTVTTTSPSCHSFSGYRHI